MALSLKQKRFADEYLINSSALDAARKAGYSEKYAKAQSHKLLENVGIKNYIEERLKKLEDEKIADQKEILQYLTAVIRGETESEIVVVENIGDYRSEARRISKAPDEKDRLKAAELLGKRYGLFTDRLQLDPDALVRIIDDIPKER
ncbi:MAG: terminase small subunit [Eubacteriales bacterium]